MWGLPQEAEDTIDANIVAKHRGHGNALLDGHLGLCWMKTSVGMALLHNQRETSPDMWKLTGQVMVKSLQTRDEVEHALAEKRGKINRDRGQAEGIRTAVAEQTRHELGVARVSQNIKAFLQGNGGRANWGDVRKGINSRDRDFFGDAVAALVAAGEVTVEKEDRAKVLVLVEGRR